MFGSSGLNETVASLALTVKELAEVQEIGARNAVDFSGRLLWLSRRCTELEDAVSELHECLERIEIDLAHYREVCCGNTRAHQ